MEDYPQPDNTRIELSEEQDQLVATGVHPIFAQYAKGCELRVESDSPTFADRCESRILERLRVQKPEAVTAIYEQLSIEIERLEAKQTLIKGSIKPEQQRRTSSRVPRFMGRSATAGA